jgi:DNA-directed RNA polymerase subunit beta'
MFRKAIPAKAYDIDPATNSMVTRGTTVGIIEAQSIGESGTQLSLRTLHVGGIASQVLKISEYRAKRDCAVKSNGLRLVQTVDGANSVLNKTGTMQLLDNNGRKIENHTIVPGALLSISDGEKVAKGTILAMWDLHNMPILSGKDNVISFRDMISGITIKRDVDASTGRIATVVFEHKEDLSPSMDIVIGSNDQGMPSDKVIATYRIPTGAHVIIENRNEVQAGAFWRRHRALHQKRRT